MIGTIGGTGARLLGVVAVALLALPFGCASVLGLQDWSDPAGAGGGTTTTGGTTSSATTSTRTPSLSDAGATCADGIEDGLETDVDCGGDSCGPCAAGRRCNDGADCQSGNCAPGGCAGSLCCQASPSDAGPPDSPDPTCADGVKNGLETDVDCGGDACPPCAAGRRCNDGADCKGGACAANACQ